jgi:hypothetical protein
MMSGTGQIVSVLRDCRGHAVSSEENSYVDVAAAMLYIHQSESGVFTALGMRYGYLESEAQRAVFGTEGSYQERVTYNYFNPYIALESRYFGNGGGYFNMGVDYPAGRWGTLFTGLSAGFYDGPGFVQKITILVSDRFDLDLSARLGSADSNFEGGFAAGLRYHIPLH